MQLDETLQKSEFFAEYILECFDDDDEFTFEVTSSNYCAIYHDGAIIAEYFPVSGFGYLYCV